MAEQSNHPNPMFDQADQPSMQADHDPVRVALSNVIIPSGLDARIKARLRVATPGDHAELVTTAIETSIDPLSTCAATPLTERSSTLTRRLAIVAALAAALLGFAFLANQWRQPAERQWLAQQSQLILDLWEHDNPANLKRDTNLAQLPTTLHSQLARLSLVGTRSLVELQSKTKMQGTLYRFDAADGQVLVLIRLPKISNVRGLTSHFTTLDTPSGGWSLAAVTIDNETYILASVCTQQQLFNYINRPAVT